MKLDVSAHVHSSGTESSGGAPVKDQTLARISHITDHYRSRSEKEGWPTQRKIEGLRHGSGETANGRAQGVDAGQHDLLLACAHNAGGTNLPPPLTSSKRRHQLAPSMLQHSPKAGYGNQEGCLMKAIPVYVPIRMELKLSLCLSTQFEILARIESCTTRRHVFLPWACERSPAP